MKSQSQVRWTVLRCTALALLLFCGLAALFSAAPSATGYTGQALALRTALHSMQAHKDYKSAASRAISDPFAPVPGRFVYDSNAPQYQAAQAGLHANATGLASAIQISEPVQTFDVFAPPPSFAVTTTVNGVASSTLTGQSLYPVFTTDERFIIFSKQGTDGHFHLFSVPAAGGTPAQITGGNGDERFPALNPAANNQLAFTSTAKNGVANLYAISNFVPGQTTIPDVTALPSLTIRPDLTNGTGFNEVLRPTWDPSGNRLAFSARDSGGTYVGIHHIYFLYLQTQGGVSGDGPSADNPPAKFTNGPGDDTDPAWSPDGNEIAFASTGTGISGANPALTAAPARTPIRSIYLINNFGTGATKISNAGADDFGPAWNPNISTANGLLAFARRLSGQSNHDIYYRQAYSVDINGNISPLPEAAGGSATKLNTDDNAGQTSTAGNIYNDIYPTWSAYQTIFAIAYSSNRSITYNNPSTGEPVETAVSIAPGGSGAFGVKVATNYTGVLVSETRNVNPPTLLPYSSGEVVHVTDASGKVRRNGDITAGTNVTLTVRLSDREAGVDDDNVYIQIKDPDSKYQDINLSGATREHKVFTQDYTDFQSTVPGVSNGDSGSASTYLYNGGVGQQDGTFGLPLSGNNNQTQTFSATINTVATPVIVDLRGAVGGMDGGNAIALGHVPPIQYRSDGTPVMSTQNPVTVTGGNPVVTAPLPGGNPNNYTTFGQEYECQYLNAQFAISGNGTNGDPGDADYGVPYYLAGIDDQGRGAGTRHSPRPEWLKLTRQGTDGKGGVLYTQTWTTPVSPSDFYLDVIAYDKAQNPPLSGTSAANFRIYDNVWGFSTLPFRDISDILVVADNTLGQKFVGTTFGSTGGLSNIPPIFYGAESYFTDIDVNKLPNAILRYLQPTGMMARNTSDGVLLQNDTLPVPEAYYLGTFGKSGNQFSQFGTLQQSAEPTAKSNITNPVQVFNGLGVNSYVGDREPQPTTIQGIQVEKQQRYSLWRILARGPLTPSVLAAYSPGIAAQPAVNDPQNASATAPAAKVPVAQRCVIWVSPFTGDFPLNVAGSLADTQTQSLLRKFVFGGVVGTTTLTSGGRLFVSGQDVVSALTLSGADPSLQGPGSFVHDVLNAGLAPSSGTNPYPYAGGPQGLSANGGRASGDAYFNSTNQNFYTKPLGKRVFQYTTPSSHSLVLGNNYILVPLALTSWRTDGSLDQLGPHLTRFGRNVIESQIDTITPQNGAHTDINFLGPGANDAVATGVPGLIYNENVTTGGGRVVFSSFGLEGLGNEYFKFTDATEPQGDIYYTYNQRANILHNIVDYLRTGSVMGKVVQGSNGGQGVVGATVYLVPASGTFPGVRALFSGTTGTGGNYEIDGVEPGVYFVTAYAPGFASNRSPDSVTVNGDSTATNSLNIVPIPPGSINGKVMDSAGIGIAGATVSFQVGTNTTSIVKATTNSDGSYNIANVPPGTYTGTATAAKYSTETIPGVVVKSGQAITQNFTLVASPGSILAHVYNASTNASLSGASVTLTPGPVTQTTDSSGNTTFSKLAATSTGTKYTVAAALVGYYTNKVVVTVKPGDINDPANIPLTLIPIPAKGVLGGIVKDSTTGQAITGVTITVLSGTTTVATTTTTTASSVASPNGDNQPQNYVVKGLAPGTYTVRVRKSGYTPPGDRTGIVKSLTFTRVDFVSANGLQGLHAFPAGLNFFSVPYNFAAGGQTFDTLLGGASNRGHIAVYQPQLLQYVLDPTPPADQLRLGQGYWVRLKNAAEVTADVTNLSPSTTTVSVALHAGWNMIGVPNKNAVPVSNLSFANAAGGGALSFADASSAAYKIISPTLYTYTGSTVAPYYTSVTAGDTAADSLQPWQAYWIYAYVDTTILIPAG